MTITKPQRGALEDRVTGRAANEPGVAEAAAEWTATTGLLSPVHPGEILLEEFIRPHGLSPIKTAARLGVPRTRIERLVAGQTRMTEDTALRLERLFGASAEFWMALQASYDLMIARRRDPADILSIVPLEP